MTRLTDDDRQFGPITYARCNPSWRPLRVVLSSGADEDHAGTNNLTVYAFGWVARLTLPRLLDDYKVRHVATSWDAATVERLGRNWYEEHHAREYGFSLSDGFLQVFLGAQTHDSTTTQSWCTHLPWTQWRFHRFSLYDAAGAEFWTQIERRGNGTKYRDFDAQREAEARCDKAVFLVDDFDGQRLTVTTHLKTRPQRLFWKTPGPTSCHSSGSPVNGPMGSKRSSLPSNCAVIAALNPLCPCSAKTCSNSRTSMSMSGPSSLSACRIKPPSWRVSTRSARRIRWIRVIPVLSA